jgi:cytochrome c oxidase cbb3-type subunit 3
MQRHSSSSFSRLGLAGVLLSTLWIAGCGAEKRAVGPAVPSSAPIGAYDPRAAFYETNAFQLSEGGRLFQWQGCGECHTETAPGAARLTDDSWRYGGTTTAIYASIEHGRAAGMPGYGATISSEQIWQLAGYVHGLPKLTPAKRLRAAAAQQGEPQGKHWTGALQ